MHVLLCDDHDLIASGIVASLPAQGAVVDGVATAGAAEASLKTAHFDVMILDLGSVRKVATLAYAASKTGTASQARNTHLHPVNPRAGPVRFLAGFSLA